MYLKLQICFLITTLFYFVQCKYVEGYSFKKFSGPVSGQIQRVQVPESHGSGKYLQNGKQSELDGVDFIAKPDYVYSYGVEDPHTGNKQTHTETRDGNSVSGEYSVVQSDGIVRTVKYKVDPTTGFQATIHYS